MAEWGSRLKWSYNNKIQVFSKGETGVGRAGGRAGSERTNRPCLFLMSSVDGCLYTICGVYEEE